jgi:hypothetical protein
MMDTLTESELLRTTTVVHRTFICPPIDKLPILGHLRDKPFHFDLCRDE